MEIMKCELNGIKFIIKIREYKLGKKKIYIASAKNKSKYHTTASQLIRLRQESKMPAFKKGR